MAWRAVGAAVTTAFLLGLLGNGFAVGAEESRFAMTHSRSQYVHWIDLYDGADRRIDPTDPNAPPYSPVYTCGRCHDFEAISHGYHFNAMEKLQHAGRAGEPWIWTDTRTGTQIPMSYRGWPGTYDPRDLGISSWDFILKFGRQLPGHTSGAPRVGSAGEAGEEVSARDEETGDETVTKKEANAESAADSAPDLPADNGRWKLSGQLAIDCMMCHSRDTGYSPEAWWEQITKQNFAWAPSVALGIADVDGDVSKLPDDFAPEAKPATGEEGAEPASTDDGPRLPKITYRPLRMNAEKKVFFDVAHKPSNDACYYCHTTRVTGTGESAPWTHDEDVHLRAGILCADCHRNGVGHDTVRAYEGEVHPTGANVATLSCRGCHLGGQGDEVQFAGGRLGAPKPLHRGLPPIHLERLSCTACHSGPRPGAEALQVQTAMAHGLGIPTHALNTETEPALVAPVMLRTDEMLYPHRMVWPAFWGEVKDSKITPLNPEAVNDALKRILRVRRNSTFTETLAKVQLKSEDKIPVLGEERAKISESELTEAERAKLAAFVKAKEVEAFQEKLAEALKELKKTIKTDGAEPVYVAGGRAYRLGKEDQVEAFANPAAEPYAWKLAHDVRPARWSTGATGCFECHSLGAPLFDGTVTAMGPALDSDPPSEKMAELAGYDRTQIDYWNQSFQGRTAFKWLGFISAGVVGLVLLSFLFLGVNGLFGVVRRS